MIDAAAPRRSARRAVLVLVVEDDPHVRMLVGLILEDEGYQVVAACDGAEALRLLRSARPHIVLLDLDLPVINGEKVIAEVRGTRESAVPVIVLSAAADGRARAARAGADGYLAKPFDLDTLVAHVAAAVSA